MPGHIGSPSAHRSTLWSWRPIAMSFMPEPQRHPTSGRLTRRCWQGATSSRAEPGWAQRAPGASRPLPTCATPPAPSRAALTRRPHPGLPRRQDQPAKLSADGGSTSRSVRGFNLLVGRPAQPLGTSATAAMLQRPRGIGARPVWPEQRGAGHPLAQGQAGQVSPARTAGPSPDHESCWRWSTTPVASPGLSTGQGLTGEMDQALSAQFITAGQYGTRCSTTMWMTRRGSLTGANAASTRRDRETGDVERGASDLDRGSIHRDCG